MKRERITRITMAKSNAMIAAGQSQTDWARLAALTEADLDAAIRDDPDEGSAHLELDWSQAVVGLPQPKAMVNMRLDRDVLDWFRGEGRGYQTRINAVLRSYVEAMRKAG
ncbi:MAG: BrnA antitoxin family protein [Sphingomonadaceae bacterium]